MILDTPLDTPWYTHTWGRGGEWCGCFHTAIAAHKARVWCVSCVILSVDQAVCFDTRAKFPTHQWKTKHSPTPMPLVHRLVTSADHLSDLTDSRLSLWRSTVINASRSSSCDVSRSPIWPHWQQIIALAINCHKSFSFVVLWRQQIIALAIKCHELLVSRVMKWGYRSCTKRRGFSWLSALWTWWCEIWTFNFVFFFVFFSFWGRFWAIFPTFSADFRCRISRGGMLQYRVSLYNKNHWSETVVTVGSRVTVSGSAGSHRDYCIR